jgi:large subunit ribosomal protein L21
MFAVVDLNGKQYRLEEGRYIDVDLLSSEANDVVEIGNVLMVVDGETTLVGTPYVEGAAVKARVLTHGRGPKVLVYKMRCKKGYRRKNGHRQGFTRLQVEMLAFPGKKATAEAPAKAEAAPQKKAAAPKKEAAAPKAKASTKSEPQAAEATESQD